ncbi:hypothetical protein [Haloplasma contractile]|uniref:Uncharacterized protein n=1 Tax=Haloplasma contractile SSD-17B TaxID=1033810 RepID=U2EDJ6_9MOLU|nr:hypothetical protein [Haloplasma contractile]ERJ13053.1 hypothetical protein HLPCO_000662 [Haloplasma contractile SSD-17B]
MSFKEIFKKSRLILPYTEDEIRKEERIIDFAYFMYPYINRFNQAGIY